LRLAAWLSRESLLHPKLLTLMMLIYIPGTIYGYYWYKQQLINTWQDQPHWLIVFVPDSPTASLWFALAMLWLWIKPGQTLRADVRGLRHVIEALGVVTSVKYGVWATVIILAGYSQGTPLDWASWMLMTGHTAMAACALIYTRFFHFGPGALAVAALWTFLNDTMDYSFGVFPYLPSTLYDDLTAICLFTFALTACSIAATAVARFKFASDR